MTDVGLPVAFAAGVLALRSPCSALLLPSFFAYAFASHSAQLRRTAVFYLGLLLTLVPLGMGASAASTLLYGNRQLLVAIAGWFIVALGLVQILGAASPSRSPAGCNKPPAGRRREAPAGPPPWPWARSTAWLVSAQGPSSAPS
jgi:cytochrome c biogenesis protein CcdA